MGRHCIYPPSTAARSPLISSLTTSGNVRLRRNNFAFMASTVIFSQINLVSAEGEKHWESFANSQDQLSIDHASIGKRQISQ